MCKVCHSVKQSMFLRFFNSFANTTERSSVECSGGYKYHTFYYLNVYARILICKVGEIH